MGDSPVDGSRSGGEPGQQATAPSGAGRPAFYAARPGRWRDWWTLLHPPYTAWHLAYVVIGATLAPRVMLVPLLATLIAFFLAVGLAAHALDEFHGRPLRTQIPNVVLLIVAGLGLAGAVGLGVAGVFRVGWALIPFLLAGPLLVIAYNAELFGGIVHTDAGFAAAWGAFPLLTSYVAQTGTLSAGSLLAAGGAFALSAAQRSLSTPAPHDAPSCDRSHRQHHAGRRRHAHADLQPIARAAGTRLAGHVVEHRAAGGRAGRGPARLAAQAPRVTMRRAAGASSGQPSRPGRAART